MLEAHFSSPSRSRSRVRLEVSELRGVRRARGRDGAARVARGLLVIPNYVYVMVRDGTLASGTNRSIDSTPQATVMEERNPRIRLILVDDDQRMRDSLLALLAIASDIEVVGEAFTGRMGVEVAGSLKPDIVLMDVELPDLGGVEATRQICAAHPCIRVIGLSTHTDKDRVLGMLEAGACGYVVKLAAYTELLGAVRGAMLGVRYLSPEIAGYASGPFSDDTGTSAA